MFHKTVTFFLALVLLTMAEEKYYPELRSDLQGFQDASRCYPDVGEWYQIYRNYYSDINFGGTSKCVKFYRYGTYENFSTPMAFSYGTNGSGSVSGVYTMTSTPCYAGKNLFTFVPDEGYGCTYWRRVSTFKEQADCCEFIYNENCGSSPKYQIYYSSCNSELGMPGS